MKLLNNKKIDNKWDNIELNRLPNTEEYFSEIEMIEQRLYGPKLFQLKRFNYLSISELLITITTLIIILIII